MKRITKTRRRQVSSATLYEVERRDKRRLAALTLPFTWSDRSAVVFKSKTRALDFVREVFGQEGAKMLGIRVVKA